CSFFSSFRYFSALLPFPTRRSSDLFVISLDSGHYALLIVPTSAIFPDSGLFVIIYHTRSSVDEPIMFLPPKITGRSVVIISSLRSEEHTSELQSRFDLVCRLLLEKK